MGGNEWTATGPYQEDLAAAFRQAQSQELAKDDHGFPGRGIVELWEDEGVAGVHPDRRHLHGARLLRADRCRCR